MEPAVIRNPAKSWELLTGLGTQIFGGKRRKFKMSFGRSWFGCVCVGQSGEGQQPPVFLSLALWGHTRLECPRGYSGADNTRSDCPSPSAERTQHGHSEAGC